MTQQINLLEPSLLPQREWFNGVNIVAGLTLSVVAIGGHWVYEGHAMNQVMTSAAQAAAPADPSAEVPVDEMERQLSEGQARLTRGESLMQAVAGLTDLPTGNAERLNWLVNALPESAWLQEVEFVGKRGVRVVGGALKAEALSGFSQRLASNPAFQDLPIQMFMLNTRDREADESGADTAKPATAGPPQYGFVVSSIAATGKGTTP